MKITKNTLMLTVAGLGLATLLLSAHATPPLKIDFSDETVGAEPKSFLSVVVVWRIESDADNKVLVVDGRQWKQGQTAAGIADKARALYGDRYVRIPRPGTGLCLLSLRGGQGCHRLPRRGNLRALRRHFRPHRSGRRD